jgi:RNA polymerase-binding protein DksA
VNLERYRDLLLAERRHVAETLESLRVEHAAAQDDEIPETGMADTASVTIDREVDISIENTTSGMLHAIDAALGRIEDGSYGRCSRCGQQIAEDRLEAVPYATLCIDCKRKEERG